MIENESVTVTTTDWPQWIHWNNWDCQCLSAQCQLPSSMCSSSAQAGNFCMVSDALIFVAGAESTPCSRSLTFSLLCQISSSVVGLISGAWTSAAPWFLLQISDLHLRRYPNLQQWLKLRQDPPLEAILVIFGRRALIFFFVWKLLEKNEKWRHFCAHAQWWSPWRRKNVEKGHLAPSNLTFLIIAIDTNGFRRMKKEGLIYKTLPQIF